jgi:hypothetical protein
MRPRYMIPLAILLISTSLRAQSTGLGSLWKDAPVATSKPRTVRPDSAVKPVKPAAVDSASKLAATVKHQADTITALKARLAEKPAAAVGVAPTTAALSSRIDSLVAAQATAAKQAAAAQQQLTQKIAGLGNFKLSGDVRVRYEGQFSGGGFVQRHRERTRARLVLGANVSDDVTGTIGVTSGTLDDVQSANQTETGFFARKTIGFDRFYVTWKPKSINGLTVTGGKFPYAWDRTALTFGNDITPEGLAASYMKGARGALQSATIAGYVLPFLEVSNGADSYVAGAQVATKWRLSKNVGARLSGASAQFRGADAIILASVAGTIKPASANTNRLRTDSTGKVLGFASGYAYTDVIGGIDFTKSARWPVTVQADVVSNRRAADGEKTGLWADLRVGRLSQVRDFQATYSFIRIERDAVVGAFIEQDLRAATNVVSHKAALSYQWRANATLGLGAWYGRLIDPAATPKLAMPGFLSACTAATPTDCRDPWLSRLQLDLSYRF